MMGNKISLNPAVFAKDENLGIAYGMGLTAEKVAAQWKVSARGAGRLRGRSPPEGRGRHCRRRLRRRDQPYTVRDRACPAKASGARERARSTDEGPRADASLRSLGEAAAGVRGEGLGHRRQQFADVRRRRRVLLMSEAR
jgi:acetyl-CoA acyltransferase